MLRQRLMYTTCMLILIKKQEASCPNTQEVGWLLEAYLPSAYREALDGGLCHQIVYTSMSCSPAYKLCTF